MGVSTAKDDNQFRDDEIWLYNDIQIVQDGNVAD
jgi:hypothetical protein